MHSHLLPTSWLTCSRACPAVTNRVRDMALGWLLEWQSPSREAPLSCGSWRIAHSTHCCMVQEHRFSKAIQTVKKIQYADSSYQPLNRVNRENKLLVITCSRSKGQLQLLGNWVLLFWVQRAHTSANQFQGPILFIKCLAKCLASLGSSIPLSGILTKTGKGDLTHPLPLTRWSPADIIFHVNKPERTRPPTNDKHVEISKRTLAYWNTGLKSPNSEEYHSTALVCAVNTRNHSSKEA